MSDQQTTLLVEGMNCASCVAHVQKAAKRVGGVRSAQVNLARGRAVVDYDPSRTDPAQIAGAITDSGYPTAPEAPAISPHAEDERLQHQAHHAAGWFRRAIIGIALWFPVELLHWILAAAGVHHPMWLHWLGFATSTISIIYIGNAFYRSALKALRHRTSNMDTLIAMGASVAYVYSVIAFFGYLARWWHTLPELYFVESTGFLALISLGHWLESRARQSAGSAIHELLNLAPATALRISEKEGFDPKILAAVVGGAPVVSSVNTGTAVELVEVPVADLVVGDWIAIRPGDRVASDGVVVDGQSTVDESMLTGESIPVLKKSDDEVIGGTLNVDGRLIVRITKTGSETALAQIVKLVETAQSSRPPVQKLADRVAAVFVPSVLIIALITGIGWYIHGGPNVWGDLRAVCSVLIIACPCALGLAVPAALMVGTGRGAKRGILIRDIDALQSAEKIDTVVLDKTGTITRGKPVVSRIVPLDGVAEHELLRLAAAAEKFSSHPIASAIITFAKDRGIEVPDPQSFQNQPGIGVIAELDGKRISVGSAIGATNGTAIHVAIDDREIGRIEIADEVKPDSAAAIRELHALNLKTVLLTGDNESAAQAVAKAVGIDDVRAGVRPGGKADVIRELQAGGKNIDNHYFTVQTNRIAMIGDGINDAPALAAADLGITIGGGSDIAKETGGIVLVSGSLHGIATAIRLSRATMAKIRQNLFFAFLYNVLAIPLAAFGLLNPLIAAAAMALSDVTVIGNALLLRRTKID